jgi:hypothetical protein
MSDGVWIPQTTENHYTYQQESMMETTQRIGEGLTFEKVWAAIQANAAGMEEFKQSIKESIKKTDRQIEETDRQIKKTWRQIKETNKQMGFVTNRFGEIVEHMVVPKLAEKFRELGFEFYKTCRNMKVADPEHHIFTEVDALLEDGDKIMIVEIKTKPKIEDIDDHIERLGKLRKYADLHNDKRKYLGAVAGAVFGDSEKAYALKNGFYAIEPPGDTFTIIEP